MSEIAVAGFSWGGISNLFAAARDNRIDALVALDGSMRYYPGLVKNSGYVHPEEITLPLLFFTQGAISLEEQAEDFTSKDNDGPNVLNAWTHGDLITVDDMALTHVEHSSMYQRNEEIWKHYPEKKRSWLTRRDKMKLFEQIRRELEIGVGTIAGVSRKLGVHRRKRLPFASFRSIESKRACISPVSR